ncbi:hypothetical protein BKA70DRAFT_1408699, partial [Coprinopsis sp. MPI-PUGE-AT-0042]
MAIVPAKTVAFTRASWSSSLGTSMMKKTTRTLDGGGVFIEEVEDHKKTFHEKYNGDLKRFFNYWPQGFRWTCCGMGGDQNFGCDHHGAGAKPCTCDFCRMGEPLPDSIYNAVSQSEYGLKLRRGPDPRSRVSPAHISIIKAGQALTGMSGA